MANKQLRFGAVGVLVVFLVLLANPAAAGHRMSFASARFSHNSVSVDCAPFGSCADSQFDLASEGSAGCVTDDGMPPHCSGGVTSGIWGINTQLFYWGPPYEAPGGCASTGMTVDAVFSGPEVLELHTIIDSGVCDPSVQLEVGPVEVAVFRYSGDPALFEGVEVASVTELVTLGLIQAEDILFRDVKEYEVEDDIIVDVDSVDVADVPAEEVVVFAAEHGISFTATEATPATSPWGAAVLAVVLLSVATWVFRRGLERASK